MARRRQRGPSRGFQLHLVQYSLFDGSRGDSFLVSHGLQLSGKAMSHWVCLSQKGRCSSIYGGQCPVGLHPWAFYTCNPPSVIQLHGHVSHHSVTQGHPGYNISHQDHSALLALNFYCPTWGRILFLLVPRWAVARWLGPMSKPCCCNSDFSRHLCWKVETGQEGTAGLPCRHEPGTVVPSFGSASRQGNPGMFHSSLTNQHAASLANSLDLGKAI